MAVVIAITCLLFGVKVILSIQQTGTTSQAGPMVTGRLGGKGIGKGSERRQDDTASSQGDTSIV